MSEQQVKRSKVSDETLDSLFGESLPILLEPNGPHGPVEPLDPASTFLCLSLRPQDGSSLFTVKNEDKLSTVERRLETVQQNGYIAIKARYKNKRSGDGYGRFCLSFLPQKHIIFPFACQRDNGSEVQPLPIAISDLVPSSLKRVDVSVRYYQPFQGCFPARTIKFGEEVYHPLYIDSWQDSSLLKEQSSVNSSFPGVSVDTNSEGECISYTVRDTRLLQAFAEGVHTLEIPLPMPCNLDMLNKIGTLRMQVAAKLVYSDPGQQHIERVVDCDVWLRIKVIQHVETELRKHPFKTMLRYEEGTDFTWSLPPRPASATAAALRAPLIMKHVLGPKSFVGTSAVQLLGDLTAEVARQATADASGKNIVHQAASTGNITFLRSLLQNELSSLRLRDAHQNTLLHAASIAGQLHIVDMLFDCGARLNLVNLDGDTPAAAASRANQHHIATMLEGEALRERTVGCRDVHRACASGRFLSLVSFVERANSVYAVEAPNREGHSPLFLAVNNNHPFAVSVLLEAGANPCIPDFQGSTLLHNAAFRGDVEVVSHIVQYYRESMTIRNRSGQTPLHIAAMHGRTLIIRLFLSHGVDTRVKDDMGCTALDLATQGKHAMTISILTRHEKPRAQLKQLDKMEAIDENADLVSAIRAGDVVTIRRLARVTNESEYRDAALDVSIKSHQLLVVQEICTRFKSDGAAVVPNSDGDLPLHAAVRTDAMCCFLTVLLSQISNVNAMSTWGATPLHMAAATGQAFFCAVLLVFGADRSLADANGLTALQVAQANGNLECALIINSDPIQFKIVRDLIDRPIVPCDPSIPSKQYLFSNVASFQGNLNEYVGPFRWDLFQDKLHRVWQCLRDIAYSYQRSTLEV